MESNLVRTTGVPPSETTYNGLTFPGVSRIVPFFPQLAPRGVALTSQIVSDGPPFALTFFNFVPTQ